jgi:glycosyltransferase involved in cell wall biosynthesis
MTGSKPRVLFLVTEDWYFCSHRLELARALKTAGFEVAIACRVTRDGEAIACEGFHLFPVKMSRSSINPFHLAASVTRIARVYGTFRPDIVHHVALKPALLGGLAARIAGIGKTINAVAGLGYVFTSSSLRARLLRPLVRFGLRLLLDRPDARVIVQNSEDGAALTAPGIVAADRLRLIPGAGVDLTRFQPAPEPPGLPRATLVARMIREKGIHETVEAARLLAARGVGVRITLAGESDFENPSAIPQRQLDEWSDEGKVEVLGHIADISALWAESHMAVLPSYYGEGVPLSLIEAAACGRPLIAADGPGLRDIVRHNETGLLVPPRDSTALADAIAHLAADPELRRRMGEAARRLAEERFASVTIIAQTLEVYHELLGDT